MYFNNLRAFISASIFFILSLTNIAHSQENAQSIVESWIASAKGYEFISINHDGIIHNNATGITTITNLGIRFSGDAGTIFQGSAKELQGSDKVDARFDYSISFPSISFTDLSQDGNYYSATLIAADAADLDFSVKGDPKISSSALGEYAGFRVENVRWAKPPEIADDPNKPISKYFPLISALTDISFERASVDSVSMVQDMGAPVGKATTSYGKIVIEKTERGNFSNMSVDGMSMQLASSGQKNAAISATSFEIGHINATDYNYRSLVESFTPGNVGEAGNNPFLTFIGEMNLDDMKVTSDNGNFSLGKMVVRDIGVRKPETDLLGEMDRLYVLSESGGKMPDEKYALELVAKLYGTMRLGEFELSNIGFKSDQFGEGKLDTYRFADFSADGLGEYLLEGIEFVGKQGELVKLDHFSLNDLKFPPLAALLGFEDATRKNDIAAMLRAAPTLASIALKGLEVKMPDQGEISIGENSIHMGDFIGPIPTRIDVVAKDIKLPVAILEREAKQVLTAMGFTDIDISASLKAVWNEATNVLSMSYATQMRDAGNIDFSAEVGGIARNVFENPQLAQNALGTLTFNNAKVTIEDRSIVEKGLAFAGAMQGVNAETMKAQAVGMLPVMLQPLGNPTFVDKLTAAVKSFLENGGSIRAQASPDIPVLIIQLMGAAAGSPGAIIDMLSVEVAADQ